MTQDTPTFHFILQTNEFYKLHYAFAVAATALAMNRKVRMLFSMSACLVLKQHHADQYGWYSLIESAMIENKILKKKNIVDFEELLASCFDLEVDIHICEMGLIFCSLNPEDIRKDMNYKISGLAEFLADIQLGDQTLFI